MSGGQFHHFKVRALALGALFAVSLTPWPLFAQEHRTVVFGEIGGASIGHADSSQGQAPIWGGGAAFFFTPRLAIEGDVHGGRVARVFGDPDHTFSEITLTGSLLFRTPAHGRLHFLADGGLALQRAHSAFVHEPLGRIDRVETIRLVHGRAGTEWDASSRVVIRTEAVLWFGGGLDWILGGRVGVGYRF
jgi:hypothetical protein